MPQQNSKASKARVKKPSSSSKGELNSGNRKKDAANTGQSNSGKPNGQPNPGKKLSITIDGSRYNRIPLKTHLISEEDDIVRVAKKYTADTLTEGDILVISERVVAISQGRSFLLEDIKPGWWARTLSQFVYDHPGGIGLRNPYTMQLAIQEAGLWRILLAAAAAVITKPFGLRGVFYHVVGNDINAIDGPAEYTLPPGNKSAKLGPRNPKRVAQSIADAVGVPVAIIDANDYGVNILGASGLEGASVSSMGSAGSKDPGESKGTAEESATSISETILKEIFADNPMGQTDEQTPLIVVRKAESSTKNA